MLLKIFYGIQVIFLTINIINTILFSIINQKKYNIHDPVLLYIIFEYINIVSLQLSILKNNLNYTIKILYSKVISIFIGFLIIYKSGNICKNNENNYICILLNIIYFNTTAILVSIFFTVCYKRRIAQAQTYIYDSNSINRNIIPISNVNVHQYSTNIINSDYPNTLLYNTNINSNTNYNTNYNTNTNDLVSYNSNNIICSICLEEKQNFEEWYNLNCNHQYHKKCIDEWFNKMRTCPDCRTVDK